MSRPPTRLDSTLCTVFASGLLLTTTEAATLVQYTFPEIVNAETGATYQPTLVDPALSSATPITDAGSAVTITTATGTYTAPATPPVLKLNPLGNATTASAAITAGTYVSFTLTAAELDLLTLNFDAARGGTGTRGYVVRSSADAFAADLAGGDLTALQPTMQNIQVDLSGAAFQNLSNITFRLYGYSPATGNTVDFDNITVTGTAVPEPGVASLAGLAGVALLTARRRRTANPQ